MSSWSATPDRIQAFKTVIVKHDDLFFGSVKSLLQK